MPTKGTKATSKKKRVAVKDLPAAKKRVSAKDMKKVKGGGFTLSPTTPTGTLKQASLGGVITTKTGGG